jgi:hypothetical protein
MRVSNLSDLKSMSVEKLCPFDGSDRTESATHTEDFRVQRERIQRLNEYCSRVTAELRASLGRTHDEGS